MPVITNQLSKKLTQYVICGISIHLGRSKMRIILKLIVATIVAIVYLNSAAADESTQISTDGPQFIASDKLLYFEKVNRSSSEMVLAELLDLIQDGELIEFYEKSGWLNEYLAGAPNDSILEDYAAPINEQVLLGNQLFAMIELANTLHSLTPYLGPEWEYQYSQVMNRIERLKAVGRSANSSDLTRAASLTRILIQLDTTISADQLSSNLIELLTSQECQGSKTCLNAVYNNYDPDLPENSRSDQRQSHLNGRLKTRYLAISYGYTVLDSLLLSLEIEAAINNGL